MRFLVLAFALILMPIFSFGGVTLKLSAENDIIADTDRHYTHRSRIDLVFDETEDFIFDDMFPSNKITSYSIGTAESCNDSMGGLPRIQEEPFHAKGRLRICRSNL